MFRFLLLLFFVFSFSSFSFSSPNFVFKKVILAADEDDGFDADDLVGIESSSFDDESDDGDESDSEKDEDINTPDQEPSDIRNYEVIEDDGDVERELIITDDDIEREFRGEQNDSKNLNEEQDSTEDLEDENEKEDTIKDLNDLENAEIFDESPDNTDLTDSADSDSADNYNNDDNKNSLNDFTETTDQEQDTTEQDNNVDFSEEDLDEPTSSDSSDATEDLDSKVDDEIDFQLDKGGSDFNIIQNIRYVAGTDQIIVDCTETASYQVSKDGKNNQLIIEVLQSQLGYNLQHPYVLKDFNTNFGLIKADQKTEDTVRIIIQMKTKSDKFPKVALAEEGNQIIIGYGDLNLNSLNDDGATGFNEDSSQLFDNNQILPAKTLEDLYFGKIKFSGKKISFHVIDAPIKQVLRFISEESGLNLVIGENVRGTVTLKLENVPWDQALYTIFKVKSLGYTRSGNIVSILPLEEIKKTSENLKKIAEEQRSLAPLTTKNISLNYGKASDLKKSIEEYLNQINGASGGTNASTNGKIISHEESNSLIVTTTAENMKKIEKIVQYLDKAPKQVMVEARIVEASENLNRNFGLTWNLSNSLPIILNTGSGVTFGQRVKNLLQGVNGSYSADRSDSNILNLQLNGLPLIGDIGAVLNVAETEGYAKLVSAPKIVTVSGKKASITRNSPILIAKSSTTTAEGATTESNEQSDVKVELSVTPTVTATGGIFLNVSVNRSDPGGLGGSFKTTRSAQTEVLVPNGHTIVIGGIYEEDSTSVDNGIPFLKNIPFLSFLSSNSAKNTSKTELLVFITPKILNLNE